MAEIYGVPLDSDESAGVRVTLSPASTVGHFA